MAEDPQPLTLQQRIAALNAAHVGRVPGEPLPLGRPKPEVPVQRSAVVRTSSINIPPEQVNGTVTQIKVGNQPNGPPPLPNRKQPPPLPNRKSSEDSSRRTSTTSITSMSTNGTTGSRALASRTKSEDQGPRIKAPAWGECELPALPEKKPQNTRRPSVPDRPKYTNRTSQHTVVSPRPTNGQVTAAKPPLPPPLPTRQASVDNQSNTPETPVRRLPPVPSTQSLELAKKAAFSHSTVEVEPEQPPGRPQRPVTTSQAPAQPPPVPHASRPDISAIQATKPRSTPASTTNVYAQQHMTSGNECFICRDFSEPDHHASLFPREQITSLQTLAQQLTSPFPSPTDKARAIFTWLHYNIRYDVDGFFAGNCKPSTPQSTLQSGLAVCEGYAALFANLATHAGLEAMVVSGHGKGFGHVNLRPGEPVPPYKGNHAWNVVRIDNGEWKLIDPCWGSGHVQGAGMPYVQMLDPDHFNMSNEEFGTKHFPSNKNHFFLPGGQTMSWEEYIQINPDSWPYHCEPPTLFSNAKQDYSISQRTLLPRDRSIQVNQPTIIRFQFGLPCPHWTLERHTNKGPPPLFFLAIHGVDGRNEDHIPLQHVRGNTPGGGGDLWYADVQARDLGAPGQKLTLFAVATLGTRHNCRGLTAQEFKQSKGRVGMSFVGVAAWDLI